MIPKVIHYCWFGKSKLNRKARICIDSWRKFLPEYEIIEWNESNFDINMIVYTRQAYEMKKYAFVSDYARFYVLYNFGGIYLDVDVEVVKSLDCFLNNMAFAGFEAGRGVAPGLIFASERHNPLIRELADSYLCRTFANKDKTLNLTTIVEYTTEILLKHGLILNDKQQLVSNIMIYPTEYFSPKDMNTGKLHLSENTYTIHLYAASWHSPYQKFKDMIEVIFGVAFLIKLAKIKQLLFKRNK